jgi:hypothetical protein
VQYRVVPVASVLSVCAVAPYIPFSPAERIQCLRGYAAVQWWYVCPYQRDRAGPARGLDWQAGIAPDARKPPQQRREEQCEYCKGLENTQANRMFVCEWEHERCLSGWHKRCLLREQLPVPRASQRFYCREHSRPLAQQGVAPA